MEVVEVEVVDPAAPSPGESNVLTPNFSRDAVRATRLQLLSPVNPVFNTTAPLKRAPCKRALTLQPGGEKHDSNHYCRRES